jgi:hypothetical protein
MKFCCINITDLDQHLGSTRIKGGKTIRAVRNDMHAELLRNGLGNVWAFASACHSARPLRLLHSPKFSYMIINYNQPQNMFMHPFFNMLPPDIKSSSSFAVNSSR